MNRPSIKIQRELDLLDEHQNHESTIRKIFRIVAHKSTPNMEIYNHIYYLCLKAIRENELTPDNEIYESTIEVIKEQL